MFHLTSYAKLKQPIKAKIAYQVHTMLIIKDTTLIIDNRSVTEGDSGTQDEIFTVSLSSACSRRVMVEYYTYNGTARHSIDYNGRSGMIVFSLGQTSKTIFVPVIGDTSNEPNKEYYVKLLNPVNATINNDIGVGTIIDNDLL